ncbi:MAG: hypothetical protein IIB99_11285, partial [Planctomycetes bacterium]|nr:hypothetical protein [Planctomycetota bacterium]
FVYAVFALGKGRFLKIVAIMVPLGLGLLFATQEMFPSQFSVFRARLGHLDVSKVTRSKSDMWRVEAFRQTMAELARSPMGMGFSLVKSGRKTLVTHSIFTDHIRMAGPLGLACVVIFFWPILKGMFRRRQSPVLCIAYSSLVGFLVFGLTHSSHRALFAWIIMGLVYTKTQAYFAQAQPQGTIRPLLSQPPSPYRGEPRIRRRPGTA